MSQKDTYEYLAKQKWKIIDTLRLRWLNVLWKSGKEAYFKNKVKGIIKKTVALDITNIHLETR